MRLALVVVLLLLPAQVSSQTPTPIAAGVPLTLQANDTQPVTGYRCYVDGSKVGSDVLVAARVSGVVTCPLPALTPGQHVVGISAYNQAGEGPQASVTLAAVAVPLAPTNVIITVQSKP